MYFSFSKEQQDIFLSRPETGMGYQIIDAAVKGSYTRSSYIILNAELAVEMDSGYKNILRELFRTGFDKSKSSAGTIDFSSDIKFFSEKEFMNIFAEPKYPGESGAIENPKEQANGEELFVRLSAFENDKRVDKIAKKLLPGSYTTTEADYLACKKGSENPVERYALPNELAIKWVFHIRPVQADSLQRGRVQPANGKMGGGKEIYFEKGTSTGTFITLTLY